MPGSEILTLESLFMFMFGGLVFRSLRYTTTHGLNSFFHVTDYFLGFQKLDLLVLPFPKNVVDVRREVRVLHGGLRIPRCR